MPLDRFAFIDYIVLIITLIIMLYILYNNIILSRRVSFLETSLYKIAKSLDNQEYRSFSDIIGDPNRPNSIPDPQPTKEQLLN